MQYRANRTALLAALVAATMLFADAAFAAKRVALVIGNDTYETLPTLNNARTDAKGMAAKLRSLGFEVLLKIDVLACLTKLFSRHGPPGHIRSDNGP